MKQFVVMKKTGFLILRKPLIVNDFRGILFYTTDGLEKDIKKINLPEGRYYLKKGAIKELNNPVDFIMPELPPFERNLKFPINFKIKFASNPNKCTIRWDKKDIIFDNALKDYPLPTLYFILYHEYGHAKYITEAFADLFSAVMLVKKGFNPSQTGKAQMFGLSDKQRDRKNFMFGKIFKRKRI